MSKVLYVRPGAVDNSGNPIGFKAEEGSNEAVTLLADGFVAYEPVNPAPQGETTPPEGENEGGTGDAGLPVDTDSPVDGSSPQGESSLPEPEPQGETTPLEAVSPAVKKGRG